MIPLLRNNHNPVSARLLGHVRVLSYYHTTIQYVSPVQCAVGRFSPVLSLWPPGGSRDYFRWIVLPPFHPCYRGPRA